MKKVVYYGFVLIFLSSMYGILTIGTEWESRLAGLIAFLLTVATMEFAARMISPRIQRMRTDMGMPKTEENPNWITLFLSFWVILFVSAPLMLGYWAIIAAWTIQYGIVFRTMLSFSGLLMAIYILSLRFKE